jgi:hypothetical protein
LSKTWLWKLQRVLELRSRRLGGSGRKGKQARHWPSMARGGAQCARARGNRRLLYPCVRRWGLSCAQRRGSRGMGTRRRGRPMAEGGAAARHTRVRCVAPANGPASVTYRKHGVTHGPLGIANPQRADPAEPRRGDLRRRRGRTLWSARVPSPIQPSRV